MPPALNNPEPARSRLTVAEQIYHQPADGTPVSAGTPFGRWLTGHADAYRRTLKVPADGIDLEFGWLATENLGCGMLVIGNSGRNTLVVERNGVEVAVVRPGENCRFEPKEMTGWRVLTLDGPSRMDLLAIPQ